MPDNDKLARRRFLRSAGVALALPWMASLRPRRARGAEAEPPRRMMCVCTPLGIHGPRFFPTESGADWKPSEYLEPFADLRKDFTVISGLSHPDVGPSHDSMYSYLTAAPHPEIRAGFRNSVSMDQVAAKTIGLETRFPFLALSCEGFSLSWTESGAMIPTANFPSSVFAQLFMEGNPEEKEAQARRLRDGRSVLDQIGRQAKKVEQEIGARDRETLAEYFESVRELERRIVRQEEWSKRPKPKVDAPRPRDNPNAADLVGKAKLMFDLTRLAFQTDSTRIVTLMLTGSSAPPPIDGVSLGHHDLSHHGQDENKLGQLAKVEKAKLDAVREFLTSLKGTTDGGSNLLDRTTVFLGSNLGDASTHAVKNLPILIAGGGFRHGQHLAFDPQKPPPLSNLYVSMLQRIGLPVERFGSSTGTLTGLEFDGA